MVLAAAVAAAAFGIDYWMTKTRYSTRRQILLAEKAQERGNSVLAEHHLKEALATLGESKGEEDDQVRVNIIDRLANLYFGQGRWQEALNAFTRVISGLIAHGRPRDDMAIIEISAKIVQCFQKTGRMNEAFIGAEWCISTLRDKIKNAPTRDTDALALLGVSLDAIAGAYEQVGSAEANKKAIDARRESLQIAMALGPEHTPLVVQCANNLCISLVLAGQLDEAEKAAAETCRIASALPALKKECHTYVANHAHILSLLGRMEESAARKAEAYRLASSPAATAELDEFFSSHNAIRASHPTADTA